MRSLKAVLGAGVLTAMMATAGCSGSGDAAACESIKTELSSVASKGMQQVSDPQALAKTYTDGAAKVREAGADAGGDVKSAADSLATVMEDFGKTLTAGNGQIPDAGAFSSASVKVTEACS
ncbi:hypothetical protein [Actinoplanes derwentensis]|uniref:Small secreted protein n=1 Tax=Actinoplanes derwentensis TaxID=113562 RepID=A0A1H1SJD0_9ACTN|nr:hypothetical protein [Actinoplanes derwentensis]GID83291.1 hypothetical protein Ade03nite_22150 [Actinoplanes derwentensis]SDS47918.1 hypothetical protein SAMN04489716_0873 [Actinoplanes derwentensis]